MQWGLIAGGMPACHTTPACTSWKTSAQTWHLGISMNWKVSGLPSFLFSQKRNSLQKTESCVSHRPSSACERHINMSLGCTVATLKFLSTGTWVTDLSFLKHHSVNFGLEHTTTSKMALNIILLFYSMYSHKTKFSAWTIIKQKCQSTLENVDDALCQIFSQDFFLYIKSKKHIHLISMQICVNL